MKSSAVIEQTHELSFGLVAPLDWSQLRTMLWEACEPSDAGLAPDWEAIASCVSERCPNSQPHAADTYRAVYERMSAQIPETRQIFEIPGAGQHLWTTLLYEAVHSHFRYKPVFMNLGFADPALDAESLALAEDEEPFRLFIQLYHHVLKPFGLKGKDILEIGCGAGGGAHFICRYFQPRSLVGIDLVQANIDAAQSLEQRPELRFQTGDAEALEFPDASFDVVVNIESSHCYPSTRRFLAEVKRVLRPQGLFLFADHRPLSDEWGTERTVASLQQDLSESGMRILRDEDITPHINHASDMLHDGKQFMLSISDIAGFDRIHFEEIMHCRGSQNYQKLRSGAWQYRCYAMQKNLA